MNKAQRDAAVQAVGKEFGYPDLSLVTAPERTDGVLIWSLPGKTVGEQLGRIVDIAFTAVAALKPKSVRKPAKSGKSKRKR